MNVASQYIYAIIILYDRKNMHDIKPENYLIPNWHRHDSV